MRRENIKSGVARKPNRSSGAPPDARRLQELQDSTPEIFPGEASPAERVGCIEHVAEDSMNRMNPGDILLIEGAESLRDLVDPAFYAILACPLCGKLDLITQAQYSGTDSVMCDYDDCSCQFRIGEWHDLIYLPVN